MMAEGVFQHVREAFVVVTKRSVRTKTVPVGCKYQSVLGKQLHLRWPEHTWRIKSVDLEVIHRANDCPFHYIPVWKANLDMS